MNKPQKMSVMISLPKSVYLKAMTVGPLFYSSIILAFLYRADYYTGNKQSEDDAGDSPGPGAGCGDSGGRFTVPTATAVEATKQPAESSSNHSPNDYP